METARHHPVSGWGRFPVQVCAHYRPEKRRLVGEILRFGKEPHFLARGLGRSYGDTALNEGGGLIEMTRLDRLLAFDEATGVLECEAGVSIEALLEVFLPRGWMVPVTPGTKFVTLGGAVANDIHGKNHHLAGSFGKHLIELTLLTPRGEVRTCSPELSPELFWASVGGIGLTGVILTLKLRLARTESAWVRVDTTRLAGIEAALELMRATDDDYTYSVAWIDCLAQGPALGRSVLMQGDPATPDDLPGRIVDPLAVPPRLPCAVPVDLPGLVVSRPTVQLMNEVFYRSHPGGTYQLVDFESYFYPLDRIRHWNRGYGRGGFLQYQVTFPDETARAGLTIVLERLAGIGCASFLAVLKRFGAAGSGWLSYPFPGFTLALDLPHRPGIVTFLQELEPRVLAHGGRLYLGKDAVMTPQAYRAMYPRWRQFRDLQRDLDPEGRVSSSMARRLRMLDD